MRKQENLNFFEYEKEDNYETEIIKEGNEFELYNLKYPSSVKTPFPEVNTVYAKYYKNLSSDKVIIVIHGLGEEMTARHIAKFFLKSGFSSLQISMPFSRKRVPKRKKVKNVDLSEVFLIGFRQAVLNIRRGIDFLEKENRKVGIISVSLGSIISSLVVGIDRRINSGVFILGGGDIANLFWYSKHPLVKIYKKRLEKIITIEELKKKWEVIEPLNYIIPEPEKYLMINAKKDLFVMPKYTEKLWISLGKPEIKWLRATHLTTIFYLPYIERISLSHFQKTLEVRPR